MATTSLQNWLPASKKVNCLYKGKNVSCHSLYTLYSPYNDSLYFLKEQVHKENKLGIMTNVGESGLVKVIFTNIHKISDTCANSLDRYIMRNIWEIFLLFIKFKFLRKNGVSEKNKANLP